MAPNSIVNDNVEINNNSDDNNNSAVDLNNPVAAYGQIERVDNLHAEQEEEEEEERAAVGRFLLPSQRQRGIRFCITPPGGEAPVAGSHCVTDDDIVIGGDIQVDQLEDDEAARCGAVKVEEAQKEQHVKNEEEGKEEEEPTIATSAIIEAEEENEDEDHRQDSALSAQQSSAPLLQRNAAISAARPIRFSMRQQQQNHQQSFAVSMAEKDGGDSFVPSSFDSGIGEGPRGSYSSLGSTPGMLVYIGFV